MTCMCVKTNMTLSRQLLENTSPVVGIQIFVYNINPDLSYFTACFPVDAINICGVFQHTMRPIPEKMEKMRSGHAINTSRALVHQQDLQEGRLRCLPTKTTANEFARYLEKVSLALESRRNVCGNSKQKKTNVTAHVQSWECMSNAT